MVIISEREGFFFGGCLQGVLDELKGSQQLSLQISVRIRRCDAVQILLYEGLPRSSLQSYEVLESEWGLAAVLAPTHAVSFQSL